MGRDSNTHNPKKKKKEVNKEIFIKGIFVNFLRKLLGIIIVIIIIIIIIIYFIP